MHLRRKINLKKKTKKKREREKEGREKEETMIREEDDDDDIIIVSAREWNDMVEEKKKLVNQVALYTREMDKIRTSYEDMQCEFENMKNLVQEYREYCVRKIVAAT